MKEITVSKILDRLKSSLKFKSDHNLAEYIGVSPQTLSKWRKRDTADFLLLLSRIPEEFDLNWYLRGENLTPTTMYVDDPEAAFIDFINENPDRHINLEIYKNFSDIENGLKIQYFESQDENRKLVAKIEVLQDTIIKMQQRQAGNGMRKLPDTRSTFVADDKKLKV
jgi:transcriptional regulator with XRE-family HTH domain